MLVVGILAILAAAIPGAVPSLAQQSDPQAEYGRILQQKQAWQQRLDQARSQIATSRQNLQAAKDRLAKTKNGLVTAQANVANLRATTPQQIDQFKEDLSGAQSELDGILKDNTDRQNKLISDLGANQQLIDDTTAHINATEQQLSYTQAQIDNLYRQIDQLNLDISANQQQLDVFLRLTYKEQRRSLLEYLLRSVSFADFIARIDSLQALDRQETQLLTLARDQKEQLAGSQRQLDGQLSELQLLRESQDLQRQTLALQRQEQQQMLEQARVEAQEATDRISAKEAELQGLIDRKEAQFNDSVQLLRNLQTAQAQLSTTIKTQAETLVKAQHNEELAQTQLDQIEREEESIAAVIARAQAGQNVRTYASGRLAWPLHGVLEQGFGPTPYKFEAPITYQGVRYPHFHTGIDIAAPAGSPIAAAANGQVIVTGYDAYGYGNYLIIAHNPTLATLYGHMSRLAVGKGLVVKQGQTIGFEGSTGNSTGPHLHFEVRVNGNFVNPLGYL